MEATKRPWTTIPELPNDVYQVIPNGYGYLGEFYDGENVSGAANAAFVARAVNTFDQARVDMQRLVDHLRLCRLFKGYEGGPLDEPWTIHIIKQAENTLAAMDGQP